MIESSSFGGSFKRTAGGVSAVTDTDVNGLMRANRAYVSAKEIYFRGDADRALFGARMSVRCIERRFYATWVVPQEIISCPIKAIRLLGRVFCFYWVH